MAALAVERGPFPPYSELWSLSDPLSLGGKGTLSVGGGTLGKRTSGELTLEAVFSMSVL